MGLVVVGWQLEDEWFCVCVLFRSVSPCCAGNAAHDLAWLGVTCRLGRMPVHQDSSLLHYTACAPSPPPRTTIFLLGEPFGIVSGTFTVQCLLVDCVCPKEVFVTLLCTFIEWNRFGVIIEVDS